MTEHQTTITTILLTTAPDGSLGVVLMFSNSVVSGTFARADVSGAWMASLIDVLGWGALSFGMEVSYDCRVRLDREGCLVELGRSDGANWFEVEAPTAEVVTGTAPPSRADRALAYLNKQRALVGRRDLVPSAAGYSDDDIIADARFYKWEG